MQALKQGKLALVYIVFILLLSIGCTPAKIVGIYFAPSEQAPEPIIALYDNSGQYIHLAIYSLTKDDFADALIRAQRRGVEVKVLIDASRQAAKVQKMKNWKERALSLGGPRATALCITSLP